MKNITKFGFLSVLCPAVLPGLSAWAADAPDAFYFGEDPAPEGLVRVARDDVYTVEKGFGWMEDSPHLFGVRLPEGNYQVEVRYTDVEAAGEATVKAEARRLMLMPSKNVEGPTRRFAVNVRRPEIEGGEPVRLQARERDPLSPSWDERLTLEFFPDRSVVEAVRIHAAPEIATVYLAGDSTMTDQQREPWAAWGQMLPRFFGPELAVANHAQSGRALYSFRWENRLEKILSEIGPGDWLFVQFGHNDQKNSREGVGPFTTYKADLEDYVEQARGKGATPVLVTPVERRRWRGGQPGETLADFAEAVRQVGEERNVPVIDLHAMSLTLYGALGEQGSTRAFVHYPADRFSGQSGRLRDNTHHSVYGAYQLARCVVEGIRAEVPELAEFLREDAGRFDPAHPDDPDTLGIPRSGFADMQTPEGD